MKLQILISSIILAGSIAALAEFAAKAEGHEPIQMNFNQMIDDVHLSDAELKQGLEANYKDAGAGQPKDEAQEEQANDDFVTYEVVHVKKAAIATDEKQSVKRVYDSVN